MGQRARFGQTRRSHTERNRYDTPKHNIRAEGFDSPIFDSATGPNTMGQPQREKRDAHGMHGMGEHDETRQNEKQNLAKA